MTNLHCICIQLHVLLYLLTLYIAGLRLSLKGHKEAFVSFSYAISPFMEVPVRVDWKVLTTEGIECQHIRYHQLQHSDDLNEIATKYKKNHAVAVILVNTSDNYELPNELCVGVTRVKKPILPAIVISSEDGRKVKEYLARHDPGELHARFESKKQSHVEPTGITSEDTPSASQQPKIKRHGKFDYYYFTVSTVLLLVIRSKSISTFAHTCFLFYCLFNIV